MRVIKPRPPRDYSKYFKVKNAIPFLSGLGLIVILYSLFTIFEEVLYDISLISIIGGGYVSAVIVLLIAIAGIITKKIEPAMIVSLLLLFEGLAYLSTFFLDVIFRDTFSRYLLLVVALVLSTFGTFVIRKQNETTYQQVHRVIASYMGWITLLYLGGSNYIDSLYYTLVMIAMILISHVSGLRYPSIPVVGSALIIETVILFDAEVINTSYIFPVAILHAIILPLIFLLQDRNVIQFKEKGVRTALSVYFLPLIPIYLAMSRGAIIAPYSHILVGVFAASWILYFSISMRETDVIYQVLITTLMVIVMLLYNIFNTGVNVVAMEIIILVVMLRLLPALQEKYSRIFRVIIFSISTIVTGKLYAEGIGIWMVVLHIGMVLVLLYLPNLKNARIGDLEFNMQALLVAVNLSILFLIKETGVSFMILTYGLMIVLYLLNLKTRLNIPYLMISIFFALVSFSSMTYNLESIDQVFIYGMIGFSLVFVIGVLSRKNFDNLSPGWIISSLPLILASGNVVNHWLINGYVALLFVCSIASIMMNKGEYWYLIFIYEAMWLRMVNYGEITQMFGVSVWSLSVMTIFIVLGLIILYTIFVNGNDSWITSVFLISSWLIASLVYQSYENYFEDLLLEDVTWMVSQIGVIIFMVLSYFNFSKTSSIQYLDKIKQFSVLGIINYLLLTTVANPLVDIFGNVITLLLLLIGNKVRSTNVSMPVMVLYLISLSSNLIGFSLTSRFGRDLFFILVLLILSYSKMLVPMFISMGESMKNLIIYGFTTFLMMIFIAVGSVLLIDGLVIFQVITVMAIIQIRRNSDESLIMQSIIYLLGNLLLLSSVFEVDFEIYSIFGSETAVMVSRFIITVMIWVVFLYIAKRVNKKREKKELMPTLDFSTVAMAVNIILLIIISASQLTHLQIVDVTEMNQGLAAVMAVSLTILALFERKGSVSTLSNGGMIAVFIVLLQSTLLAFFSQPLAIILLSIIAIFLSIIAFYSDDRKLIMVSIAIFILVVFKLFIDLIFFINPLDKAISGIITGIDLLWFAATFNRISNMLKPVKISAYGDDSDHIREEKK